MSTPIIHTYLVNTVSAADHSFTERGGWEARKLAADGAGDWHWDAAPGLCAMATVSSGRCGLDRLLRVIGFFFEPTGRNDYPLE